MREALRRVFKAGELMFPRDLKHLDYFFSERTRGLFQYGERHLAQLFGGCGFLGCHERPQRLQVRVGKTKVLLGTAFLVTAMSCRSVLGGFFRRVCRYDGAGWAVYVPAVRRLSVLGFHHKIAYFVRHFRVLAFIAANIHMCTLRSNREI